MAAGGNDVIGSSSDTTADRKLTESRDREAVHDGSDVSGSSVDTRSVHVNQSVVGSKNTDSTATDAEQTNTGTDIRYHDIALSHSMLFSLSAFHLPRPF